MRKNKFIELFCEENNFSYEHGKRILKSLSSLVALELKKEGSLTFKNFGKFALKERQEKFNNFTGKIVPRHLYVSFKASKKLRDASVG